MGLERNELLCNQQHLKALVLKKCNRSLYKSYVAAGLRMLKGSLISYFH
jgi:hypothetical protein